MTTTHTPRRIQRKRTPGWTLAGATDNPNGAVIADRTSRYGNPFTIALATEFGYEQPRAAAVSAFDEWLSGNRDMWQSDEGDRRRERILDNLHRLRGRDLACACDEGDACHADVLIRRANDVDVDRWVERVRARVARNRDWRGEPPLAAGPTPEPGCPGLRCSNCDQHGEGWLEPISDARCAPSARYVIGRDGVFATLYDRQVQRLVVENATEAHCRKVRDQLLAAAATRGPDNGGVA